MGNPPVLARARDETGVPGAVRRREVAVGESVESDRRDGDGRLGGEAALDVVEMASALGEAEPVTVGMDDQKYQNPASSSGRIGARDAAMSWMR